MNITKFFVSRYYNSFKQYKRNTSTLDCHFPRPLIVTITGVNSRVGKALAFILKQSRFIDVLKVYDFQKGPSAIALDLSHINTNCKIRGYEGLPLLKSAVDRSHIVVIVGGEPTKKNQPHNQLFKSNANYVRYIASHTSEFNSKAIVCIETPPISAMVPLVCEEYKKAKVYDPKKILGVATIGVMRSNSAVADFTKKDPGTVKCPIVGCVCRHTMVPVLSQADVGQTALDETASDMLNTKITGAESEVLQQKSTEDSAPCVMSLAYSTARFVESVAKGLLNKQSGWECAFVRQTGHIGEFLPYMASIVTLGNKGVEQIRMPKLSKQECIQLRKASGIIRDHIKWGEGFVTGKAESKKRRFVPCRSGASSCSLIKIGDVKGVGDVIFDPDHQMDKKPKKSNKTKQK